MTKIDEQCNYVCGPYQGYFGKAEYDSLLKQFYGEVVGTRDVVTFEGRTLGEVRDAFSASVDDYLAYCRERGEQPEKPFSGKFMVRIDPDVHRKISQLAERENKSLNQFVCDCLSSLASQPRTAGAKSEPGLARPAVPERNRESALRKGRGKKIDGRKKSA